MKFKKWLMRIQIENVRKLEITGRSFGNCNGTTFALKHAGLCTSLTEHSKTEKKHQDAKHEFHLAIPRSLF